MTIQLRFIDLDLTIRIPSIFIFASTLEFAYCHGDLFCLVVIEMLAAISDLLAKHFCPGKISY